MDEKPGQPSLRPVVAPESGRRQASAILPRMDDSAVPQLADGFAEVEYLLSGVANTYAGQPTEVPEVADRGISFTTRVLARFPTDAARFSGRVLVEPLNTSNGPDSDALWARVAPLLHAEGDAWVGVSVRASSAAHLSRFDERYADLDLASNDLAWDVLRQLGALLRTPAAGELLSGLVGRHVYLGGYSQSGADTATFATTFHAAARAADGTPVFDGYFPAAHSAGLTPVHSGDQRLPVFHYRSVAGVDVPVVDVETQSDVEGFRVTLTTGLPYTSPGGASVRREDSDAPGDLFRLYEVAGAAHLASRAGCEGTGTGFPIPAFLRAGLARLHAWNERGTPPPKAPRLTLTALDEVADVEVDEVGNACGGVRAPHLDVPLSHYGVHSSPGGLCALVGRETTLPRADLEARYGSVEAYAEQFTTRLDACIALGYLLELDRADIIATQTRKAQHAFSRR